MSNVNTNETANANLQKIPCGGFRIGGGLSCAGGGIECWRLGR